MTSILSIPALKKASYEDVAASLGLLFEPTEALNKLIYSALVEPPAVATTYSTYPELIESVRFLLLSQPIPSSASALNPAIANIISAHPRLGAKKVDSAQSQAEQASLQRDPKDLERVRVLNEEYEKTFPGLRYVVFVNGRPLPEIIANMEARIARNNFAAECKEAFNAMCDIAIDRSKKLRIKGDSNI
ncbi:uncharacterized protein SAPINGB_P002414 [Magnusiomyces paraingens]|uniref:Oxo-4-hydroxy-4-carboxy-5-ureidoimidazoline decarboxylase domain-containing protein n=1 Tax=Magnusiomyces paraingens TaxID=2606893 RepID=A0A5E8BE21_9ASCO|nr:uncharacterized protein SAPINGB_P002414 [Saprochaete ingens]VVT49729.1 unnamed protein product [Saprochaete ingens]